MNLHTNGLLARRCYYTLVSVLNATYDGHAVAEHTGEVIPASQTMIVYLSKSSYSETLRVPPLTRTHTNLICESAKGMKPDVEGP